MERTPVPDPETPGQGPQQQPESQPSLWSAQRFYRPYVRWSLIVALTLGFSTGTAVLFLPALGIPAGLSWVTHTQAHGVAQIFGWAGLFLMGMAYHVVPRFRNGSISFPWPQRAVLALVLVGIVLRFAGQTSPLFGASPILLVASGVSLALGMTLFVVTVGQALRQGPAPHTTPEAWVWMSFWWALVAVGLQLAIVTLMALNNLLVAPPFLNEAFVQAALLGFIGNFIMGITLRAVPAFMALPTSRMKLVWVALVAINSGLLLTVSGALLGFTPWVLATGQMAVLLGLVVFVIAIRLYSSRSRPRRYTLGAYGRYEWYLRAGYAWILVAGVLQSWNGLSFIWPDAGPPMSLAAPALHALSLGFVTMIIMGMAARMLPLFEGAILPLHWLMDASFALLNFSVLLRIAFGIFPSPVVWTGLALSGSLGTLALLCFTVVVWRTLHPSSRERYAELARNLGQQHLVNVQVRQGPVRTSPPA